MGNKTEITLWEAYLTLGWKMKLILLIGFLTGIYVFLFKL